MDQPRHATVAALAVTVPDSRLVGDGSAQVNEVVYDSRTVRPGHLFAALVGADVDGHRFVPAAVEAGAAALLVEREQAVRQGLRQLDDRCRELLTALFFDPAEPGYDQIAARLRMAVGSVGPTRARCFRKLESILHRLGFDHGE